MSVKRVFCSSSALAILLCLVACKSLPTGKSASALPTAPVTAGSPSSEVATEVKAQVQAPPPQVPQPVENSAVRNLLTAAAQAMLVDQLTTPEFDNAFDRYQAVLLLSPGNAEALDGLREIQLRYVDMSREALRQRQFSQAQDYLVRARMAGNNDLLIELGDDIERKRKEYFRQREQLLANTKTAMSADNTELTFNTAALSRKDQSVIQQLHNLAFQVRTTDETLQIIARNDAEGRWMYQMMKEAVPGYRIRGDISVGRVPKIRVLPPIE